MNPIRILIPSTLPPRALLFVVAKPSTAASERRQVARASRSAGANPGAVAAADALAQVQGRERMPQDNPRVAAQGAVEKAFVVVAREAVAKATKTVKLTVPPQQTKSHRAMRFICNGLVN